jgi:transposase-like protein
MRKGSSSVSQEKSRIVGHSHNQRYTEAQKAQVLAYIPEHGINATCQQFGIHRSVVDYWRKNRANGNGQALSTVATARGAQPSSTYMIARKLRAAVKERLRLGADLDDLTIYAHLLTKEILGD